MTPQQYFLLRHSFPCKSWINVIIIIIIIIASWIRFYYYKIFIIFLNACQSPYITDLSL